MLTVTWSGEEVSCDSQLLSVAYIVMVEVESHAEQAKVLIGEVDHLGEELLHHRLCDNNERNTNTHKVERLIISYVLL